jgi:hypothetical protein
MFFSFLIAAGKALNKVWEAFFDEPIPIVIAYSEDSVLTCSYGPGVMLMAHL